MPNEFQNRDSMLNSIAQNAANNTMINPKPVEEGIKVPPVQQPVNDFQMRQPHQEVAYQPNENVGLKPATVDSDHTFYGFRSDVPNQNPINTGSSYETMTPPKPVAIDPNFKGLRADASWKAPDTTTTAVTVHAPVIDESTSGIVSDDDIDMSTFEKQKQERANEIAQENEKKKVQFNITINDVKATMPSITGDELDKKSLEMMGDLKKYRTNLIVNEGMTPEEADEATKNRMKHLGTKLNNEWIDQHPHTGVITINKEDSDKLALTPEEHDKLVTTKSIKLVCVENKELETLKVIDTPTVTKDKLLYIRKSNNAGARYSLPMPIFGDYVTFHGATARSLMQEGIDREKETTLQALERKAQFVYDHFIGGHLMNKYNENGVTMIDFNEFCNKFPWFDIDLAIYGIYVASSPETYTGAITCSFCNEQFDYDFHADKMLITDDFSDNIKKSIDNILQNVTNEEGLKKIHDNNMSAIRMKSPKTNNIYSIQTPTISKARSVFNFKDNDTDNDIGMIVDLLIIREMWIWIPENQAYIHIESNEQELMYQILKDLNEYDYQLISKFLPDYIYVPRFGARTKCPKCDHDLVLQTGIDELVFLLAQDITAEIQ